MAIEPSIDDLKALAELRLDDARTLLAAGRHSGAFYLAGYSVECALKAIIARGFRQGVIPSKRFVERVYTHNLNDLMSLSGLKPAWDVDADASVDLKTSPDYPDVSAQLLEALPPNLRQRPEIFGNPT